MLGGCPYVYVSRAPPRPGYTPAHVQQALTPTTTTNIINRCLRRRAVTVESVCRVLGRRVLHIQHRFPRRQAVLLGWQLPIRRESRDGDIERVFRVRLLTFPVQSSFSLTSTSEDDYGDVAGFLAADSTNKLLILSFRGSRTIDNWIANLDFGLDDVSGLCSGCKAHGGFYKAWQAVADDITTSVKSAVAEYKGYKLVFTGHSFGAAMATFAATALRNDGYEIDLVCSLASPIRNAT